MGLPDETLRKNCALVEHTTFSVDNQFNRILFQSIIIHFLPFIVRFQ